MKIAVVVVLGLGLVGCKSSHQSFACDNGAGGLSETLCAQWATQGGCESHAIVPDGGTVTLTCGATSTQYASTCCELTNCGDTSFLYDDAGLPIAQSFPSPSCPTSDAGAD